MKSICGIDCTGCPMRGACGGCAETGGRPFGAQCVTASCCRQGSGALAELKQKLMDAFNALSIEDMEEVTDLSPLKGSFINLTYVLPGGQSAAFWDDNKIYLGSQLHKKGSDRCYGIAADETYLMVSEYGASGASPEIILFKRWN